MITLHRLGHAVEPFQLNPDLIMTVEANPDTVITLTTGTKVVVAESPERVAEDVRCYRIDVLAGALERRGQLRAAGAPVHKASPLHVVPPASAFARPVAVEHHRA
jgi:flagellar protein FlbD